jgi:peroxiredoxin/mono/diheme cytochrome c family protein
MRHVCKLPAVLTAGVVLILCALGTLCAVVTSAASTRPEASSPIGKQVDDFALQDFRSKSYSLADSKDAKVVVLAFLGVECPLSKLYGPRLAEMAQEYESKGVAFVAIDSNRQDSVTEMGHYAKEHKIAFPFLKDLNNMLADKLGASRNPHVFVLDAKHVIRYAGRVDDQYGFQTGSGYAKTKTSRRDLASALDELLDGKAVSQPTTEAIGCLIGRVRKPDAASDVTYSNQIARLFEKRCVECHRPGQIGPFALQSYEEAAGWAEMIEEVVRDERMPPWHADPKFGQFKNNASLTDAEKTLIQKWVAAGAPEGDRKDLPEPRQFAGSWMMPGGPDKVFFMTEEPVDVPAEGTVEYRYYTTETGFTEDKWVKVAECMPGNRGVVHHMIVFLRPPADEEGGGGQESFGQLTGFAPGTRPHVLPPGMAKLIPAGWRLTFQMHYTPNGSPQTDRSSVGIKFEDPANVKYRVATANAMNVGFEIPPGDPAYKVESATEYKSDVLLLSLFPHMHLRGKDFHYEVSYPDGKKETLLNVPRYDFNWQSSFVLSEPKTLPGGTTLHCTAHFDNSEDNLANPDPTQSVRWGDQTWEEMMIGWFDIAVPKDTKMSDVLRPRQGGRRNRGQQRQQQGDAAE